MQFPVIAAVPPASAPEHVGNLYLDTSEPALYFAKGISAVSDWIKLSSSAVAVLPNTTAGTSVAVTVEGTIGPPDTRQIVLGAES